MVQALSTPPSPPGTPTRPEAGHPVQNPAPGGGEVYAPPDAFEPPTTVPRAGGAERLLQKLEDAVWTLKAIPHKGTLLHELVAQAGHVVEVTARTHFGPNREQEQRWNAPAPEWHATAPLGPPPPAVHAIPTTPLPANDPEGLRAEAAARAYLPVELGALEGVGRDASGALHATFQTPGDGRSQTARQTVVHLGTEDIPEGATLTEIGPVPAAGKFFDLSFTLPPGIQELQVDHALVEPPDDLSARRTILDVGLYGPDGFRGYGGGNREPVVTGVHAASRSYLTGPLTPGTWTVKLGKPAFDGHPHYRVRIDLRTSPTLAEQPERSRYLPAAPLESSSRWYQGDLHVHTAESGDSHASPADTLAYAKSRHLDFIELSEHNTTSQDDFLNGLQAQNPKLLLMPGMEYTTYKGHVNAIGATHVVPPFAGSEVNPFPMAAEAFKSGPERVLLSLNHPSFDFSPEVAWSDALPPPGPSGKGVDGVEIANGNDQRLAGAFDGSALAFYEKLCAQGYHPAMLGGSDDHAAGQRGATLLGSSVGSPTTLIHADNLSVAALEDGIAANRTVVKLHGPADPMLAFKSEAAPAGDTVTAPGTTFSARITGGKGAELVLVKNGERIERKAIPRDDFSFQRTVDAPSRGEDRYRMEVWVDGRPRTLASYLWLRAPTAPTGR